MNLICVADRQHQRVQCFDKEGHFRYTIKYDKPVYGVSFRPNSGNNSCKIYNLVNCKITTDRFELDKHIEVYNCTDVSSIDQAHKSLKF